MFSFVFSTESWLLLTYGDGDGDQKDEFCKLARRVQILITCNEDKENVNMVNNSALFYIKSHKFSDCM
jgi:hypothetical protein